MKKSAKRKPAAPSKRSQAPDVAVAAAHTAFERERLLHDLQIHQIKLETQNRELREMQRLLELSRDRYVDLYDFAPVGYVTLDDKGLVQEINLTAAGMLGLERSRLIGLPFSSCVAKGDLPPFREHFRRVAQANDHALTVEVGLTVKGGGTLPVELRSVAVLEGGHPTRLTRSTITDLTDRQAAEVALRTSQERLERALGGAELGLWERDLRTEKLVLNPRWAEMLGYTASDISAGPFAWMKTVHSEDWPRVNEATAAHLAGKTPFYEVEFRLRAKSGEWRWVLSRGKVIARDSAGQPLRMAGSFFDIHPRRQVEEALRNNEARLHAIFNNAVEGFITIDEFGVIESFNPAAERMFGCPAKAAIGQNVSILMPPPAREQHDSHLAHGRLTGEGNIIGFGREVVGQRKDGSTFPMDLSVSEVRLAHRRIFTGIIRDVTRRKQAGEKLRESEERYRALVEMSPDGIFVNCDDRITFINAAGLRLFGATDPQQIIGKSPLNFFHESCHEVIRERIACLLADGGTLPLVEQQLVRLDGGVQTVEVTAARIPQAGNPAIQVVVRDITERRRVQESLEESEARYRTMFTTLIEGFCIIEMIFDADARPVDYRFLEVNPAFEKQTGLPNAQGRLMRELVPDHEAHWFEIYGRIALTGEPARFVNEAGALNRWFEVSAFRLGGAESRKVAILFNDITEAKHIEEALLKSERRERQRAAELAAILDAVPTPVFIAQDPACLHMTGNRAADGLLRVSRGAEASLTAPEETRPRHVRAVKNGRDLSSEELPAQRAARGILVQDFEFSLVFDDGTVREMLAYATPLWDDAWRPRGAINVLIDITERKQAEEALRRSELMLTRAQEIAHVGSYEINAPQFSTTACSAETFRILGLEPVGDGPAPDEYVQRIVHPEDRDRVRATLEHAIRKGGRYESEYRIVRPDGSLRYLHSVAEPQLGPDGQALKLIGYMQDITERKMLEQEILKISEREQSRIGQDLHDGLCQHLAGIEFRLLAVKQGLEAKANKQAAEVSGLAQLVRQAIEQTRTLARGLSPVLLEADGLMNALHELAINTEPTFNLTCTFHCPAPVLIHDNAVATHLYRIAQEAVHNAIRHGQAKAIVIHLFTQNNRLVLGVKDDGIGFPASLHKHDGMGLRVMHYRAGMVGGSLVVLRPAEGGASVVCSLHLLKEPEIGRPNNQSTDVCI